MACPDEDIISAYVDGALGDDERRTVETHLEGCETCALVIQAFSWVAPKDGSPLPVSEGAGPDGRFTPGTQIGATYKIERKLGVGGMGQVYLATHLRLDKQVAIKVLNPQLDQFPDVYDRFRREARVCAALRHRNIVDVIDFNRTDDGFPYMVMEYLEGQDLGDVFVSDSPLSWEAWAPIMRQICSALDATHRAGVIHRDLKPSNILLCRDEDGSPSVKILDFGISKAKDGLATITGSSQIVGTPSYLSPEMAFADHDKIDHRADLFALGAIAYEALSGKRAFHGDTLPRVIYQVVHHNPRPLGEIASNLPAGVSALIMGLLSKTPSERPEDAKQVRAAIDAIDGAGVTGEALARTLPSPLPGTYAAQQPKSAARLLLIMIAVAVVLGGAWFALLRKPAPTDSTAQTVRKRVEPKPAKTSKNATPVKGATPADSGAGQAIAAPDVGVDAQAVARKGKRRPKVPAKRRKLPPKRPATKATKGRHLDNDPLL